MCRAGIRTSSSAIFEFDNSFEDTFERNVSGNLFDGLEEKSATRCDDRDECDATNLESYDFEFLDVSVNPGNGHSSSTDRLGTDKSDQVSTIPAFPVNIDGGNDENLVEESKEIVSEEQNPESHVANPERKPDAGTEHDSDVLNQNSLCVLATGTSESRDGDLVNQGDASTDDCDERHVTNDDACLAQRVAQNEALIVPKCDNEITSLSDNQDATVSDTLNAGQDIDQDASLSATKCEPLTNATKPVEIYTQNAIENDAQNALQNNTQDGSCSNAQNVNEEIFQNDVGKVVQNDTKGVAQNVATNAIQNGAQNMAQNDLLQCTVPNCTTTEVELNNNIASVYSSTTNTFDTLSVEAKANQKSSDAILTSGEEPKGCKGCSPVHNNFNTSDTLSPCTSTPDQETTTRATSQCTQEVNQCVTASDQCTATSDNDMSQSITASDKNYTSAMDQCATTSDTCSTSTNLCTTATSQCTPMTDQCAAPTSFHDDCKCAAVQNSGSRDLEDLDIEDEGIDEAEAVERHRLKIDNLKRDLLERQKLELQLTRELEEAR